MGGLLGGKAGVTVFHMGTSQKTLKPIEDILENSDVPITKLLPTHVNRCEHLFAHAIEFAKRGGYIDLTSGISPELGSRNAIKPSKAIKRAVEQGAPIEKITLSSDGQGSQPVFNAKGELIGISVAGFESLMNEFRDLIQQEGFSIEDALKVVTSNVATLLHFDTGTLKIGKQADILVFDDAMQLDMVFAKGQIMVKDAKACVFGTFE